MATPIFTITDGETRVNLITKTGSGINTLAYTPMRQTAKEGGVWADSSVANGRQIQMRKLTNIIDVITLGISGNDQDIVIEQARNLTTLLEKATQYWITEWQNEPVWLERRGSNETETSYTLIHGYKWENDNNPFAPPFYVPSKPSAISGVDLAIEHGPWLANEPGESECVAISNIMSGGGTSIDAEPTDSADDASAIHEDFIDLTNWVFGSTNDAFINSTTSAIDTGSDYLIGGVLAGEDYSIGMVFSSVFVPNGATILEAKLSMYDYPTKAYGTSTVLRIYGEDADTAASFSTYANFVGRSKTSNYVDWGPFAVWPIPSQPTPRRSSPDLKDIVQEVVDRAGWASGNNMCFILDPTNAYNHYFSSYDHLMAGARTPYLYITYRTNEDTIFTAQANLQFGFGTNYKSDVGIRFRSVAIPAGADILSAKMTFEMGADGSPSSGFSGTARIVGENNVSPAAFSTFADFVGRSLTTQDVTWSLTRWLTGNSISTPEITSIIQEIIDTAGWASGNDMVLFVKGGTGENKLYPAAFDSAVYDNAILNISYATEGEIFGVEETCNDEVYVSNKDNKVGLSYIYHYDDSTATFSSNLLTGLPGYDLLPDPAVVDDIVYFGGLSPFSSLVFDLETAGGSSLRVNWEYWSGAAWVAIPTFNADKAGYDEFIVDGVGAIVWEQPSNWATVAINGDTAYWARAIVTTGDSAPAQSPSRHPYTVIKSSVDIDDQISGDITAISKIQFVSTATSRGSADKIVVGLRSKDRGENFVQHINFNGQNNDDISVTIYGLLSANQALVDSPTGGVIRTGYLSTEAMTREFQITINPPLASEYYGRYRAFVRAIGVAGLSDGEVTSYLNIGLGAYRASKQATNISTNSDNWCYFDYGIITLPPAILPTVYEGSLIIQLYAKNDYGVMDFDWVDLVLVPVDEYAVEINASPDATTTRGDIITADSLSYMGKSNVFSVLRYESDYQIKDIPLAIASGPIQLQANADQRLYFFVMDASAYEWLGRIQVWKNERYLTFRGDE